MKEEKEIKEMEKKMEKEIQTIFKTVPYFAECYNIITKEIKELTDTRTEEMTLNLKKQGFFK